MTPLSIVDLSYTVLGGQPIPVDHGYHLYSALVRILPGLHTSNGIGIHPIRGRMIGNRQMQLADFSRLVIRAPAERIAELLPLSGKQLQIGQASMRAGVPQVHALRGTPVLRSRLVTVKLSTERSNKPSPPDESSFLAAVRRQLDALSVSAEVAISLGKRRTLRIKDKEVVGYEVTLTGLPESESLAVQTEGLGGRRHMGCGLFAPCRNGEA